METPSYTKASVVSRDGTIIGYRQMGTGPGVILVHGGMEASQNLMPLGAALADQFTVYVMDRRGRGLSGPFGEHYSVARDCEDIAVLVEHTGAEQVFGLSAGALITLRAALTLPQLKRIALYEPPLSLNGSMPNAWVPRYDREMARGNLSQAFATTMKGSQIDPKMAKLPRFVLVSMAILGMRLQGKPKGDDVAIASLIATMHYDMIVVGETANTLPDYTAITARVLLLGGGKSPDFFRVALDALVRTIPNAERVAFPNLDHLGPSTEGKPAIVAASLRTFFA